MMNKFKKESFSNNSFQLNFRLIRVTEAGNGVVGQPCQFRVDASQAGEGQLEISINDGEVPNHVQVCQKSENIFSFRLEGAQRWTLFCLNLSKKIIDCFGTKWIGSMFNQSKMTASKALII